MDLLILDTAKACNTPQEFELLSPGTGDGIGVFITVIGKDSDKGQELSDDHLDDVLRKNHKSSMRSKPGAVSTAAKIRKDDIDYNAALVTGWRSVDKETKRDISTIQLGKEKLVFSLANAKKLFTALPWTCEQTGEKIYDIASFMRNSKKA